MASRTTRTPADSAPTAVTPRDGFDWRRIAYNTLVSRALDDVEEATNRNRAQVPKEHVVLYQFCLLYTSPSPRDS